jgi:hypothetical protein
LAQGTLTPPGAPAPTMKSLDQIEPRTPISSVPYTITNPGSYYLTTNLTTTVSNAIVIATNGVTLDLSGFTISSTVANAASGGTAILLGSGISDITICNGHILGGVTNNGSGVYGGNGFCFGIWYAGSQPLNVLVSRVSVSGCLYYGIYLYYYEDSGHLTVVESCTVRTAGTVGIEASTVKQSSAIDCGFTAVRGDQVSDCIGQSGFTSGVAAITAQNCYGSSSSYYGIDATTAQNCYGSSSSSDGVMAYTAENCFGESFGNGIGLTANTALNCYGVSYGTGSYGIYAGSSAKNCYGSTAGQGYGIFTIVAEGCYGYSGQNGFGILCSLATGCYGRSTTAGGIGLKADTAIGCEGYELGGGIAIQANIANSCFNYAGTESITYKYNMP